MKKIFFIHNSLPEYRIQFWKELQKYSDVIIYVLNNQTANKIYGLNFDYSNLKIIYHNRKIFTELSDVIKLYDFVILPPADNFYNFFFSLKIIRLCNKFNVKSFYWTEKWESPKNQQSFYKRIKNFVHKKMIVHLCNNSYRCIASGTKSKCYLTDSGINEEKISIAYDSSTSPFSENTIDIRKKYRISENKKIILYLGRLISRKGCEILTDICSSNFLIKNNSVLLICGTGVLFNKLNNSCNNNEFIVFTGKIEPKDRRRFFEQCDLFVLPSIVENGVIEAWGLTVNESLECGLPVVTTDAVGASYDLIDKSNGVIVSSNKIKEELGSAISFALKNNYDRKYIKKRYQFFSVNSMAKKFYESLIK